MKKKKGEGVACATRFLDETMLHRGHTRKMRQLEIEGNTKNRKKFHHGGADATAFISCHFRSPLLIRFRKRTSGGRQKHVAGCRATVRSGLPRHHG